MSGQRSLRQVLARQWIAFTLVLFAGFAAMALLLLWLLEDSFINQRLRDVAATLDAGTATPALPETFRRHAAATAPAELRAAMADVPTGGIREFRLPDGRYVHVLAGQGPGQARWLLVYDVSAQMRVNDALVRGLPWLALIAAALALAAYALANLFTARIVARLAAEAWDAQRAALQSERETLAFLGHELRTPLQSARTSLALLHEDRGNDIAWRRLQRAVDRLARASNGVLWLASDAAPGAGESCCVGELLDGMIEEFAPLAIARQQTLRRTSEADATWPLPTDAVETVLANLLLNAIQHGGAGEIEITVGDEGLTLANPRATQESAGGFGLGLQVVQRLLGRFAWSLSRREAAGRVVLTIAPASSQTSPVA